MLRIAAALLCLCVLLSADPARAARPLPDLHKWDSYFALFARDSSVPWKQSSVRLDTYSSAPVEFAVFAVDPADVIVAGANARPRTIDTTRIKAVARWRYTPPGGYRFASNEIGVPLGQREGFFVVEARRNNVAEQVWINRTRIGLLSKQSGSGLVLYGADLGSGRALSHMRVAFLVHNRFDVRFTDAHGLIVWENQTRPIFAIAEYAQSKAFLSFLPQAPVPSAVAGVILDSAVVRAGEDVRVIGFARVRGNGVFKAASGDAAVSIRRRGVSIGEQRVHLDQAGALVATFHIPPDAVADDYTVLMTAGAATAGAALHVDGNAGGLSLMVAADCHGLCTSKDDVPIVVHASRNGAPVSNIPIAITVVRSPHVAVAGAPVSAEWGTTKVLSQTALTGADGAAHIAIARPSDGLSSTYGVRASSDGATASARVLVPTASIALHVQLDRVSQSLGDPIGFDIFGATIAEDKPAAHLPVRVQLVHGTSVQEQEVTLDGSGRARAVFNTPELGSNLIIARATSQDGDAMDAQEVQIVPQAIATATGSRSDDVSLSVDRRAYHVHERIGVTAAASGAAGDALLTYETPSGIDSAVVGVHDGRAQGSFSARNTPGSLQVGAAFVRDGELRWNTIPVALIGAGRPQSISIHLEGDHFAPGAHARLKIDEGKSPDRTIIVRMSSGVPSGSARFDGAPGLLSIGEAASQDTAPQRAEWHAWVDATPARASTLTFDRGVSAPPEDLSIADAGSQNVYWLLRQSPLEDIEIPMPPIAGLYTLSILEFGADGHIAAAATPVTVR